MMLKNSYYRKITLLILLLGPMIMVSNSLKAQNGSFSFNDSEIDGEAIPRLMLSSGIDHIVNNEGNIALILTHQSLVIQLTNEGLDAISNEISKTEKDEDSSLLGDFFRSVLSTSLYNLLDHGIAIPLKDIKSAEYKGGELRIYTRNNEILFEDFDMNDKDLIDDFKRSDAMRFAQSINDELKQ